MPMESRGALVHLVEEQLLLVLEHDEVTGAVIELVHAHGVQWGPSSISWKNSFFLHYSMTTSPELGLNLYMPMASRGALVHLKQQKQEQQYQ
jgi:hypothetical protein